jgi:large subunit ribosomal protein L18e
MKKLNIERGDVKEWLDVIRKAQQAKRKPLYARVYELVAVPSRRRASVDLYKISRHTKEGENVIVPGKVLGMGPMAHGISIAAISFSASARKNLKDANCKIVSIKDMLGMSRPRIIV